MMVLAPSVHSSPSNSVHQYKHAKTHPEFEECNMQIDLKLCGVKDATAKHVNIDLLCPL